jgi:integral membrane sensor domain MASE1
MSHQRWLTTSLGILVTIITYTVGAQLGLLVEIVGGQVTALWPPTGIALAALLLLGVRVWPGIALGALLVNGPISPSPLALAAITVGNTVAPLCAYWMLQRAHFHLELNRLRDANVLVVFGALAAMLISSFAGSAALLLAEAIPDSAFWTTWSVWWVGDAAGVLSVTPLFLLFSKGQFPRKVPLRRRLEAIALAVSTLAVMVLVTWSTLSLLFLAFPVLTWAAFRFQLAGTAPCVLVVVTAAGFAAKVGAGAFSQHSLFSRMINMQAFSACMALMSLLLAALITQRNETHAKVELLCTRLSEAVSTVEEVKGNREVNP